MNKEELEDEMKNRISMALKDTILQQGFEIICKENAELKAFINAPLIKGRRTTRKEFYQTIWDLSGQLTTAKELLKWWVNHCGNHDLHYAKKTEQFLKDSEVEK